MYYVYIYIYIYIPIHMCVYIYKLQLCLEILKCYIGNYEGTAK